jgi:organic radical activating enzyme
MITVEQFCDEIVEEAGHVREVSITGGEPMHYIHQMHKIIGILSAKGYKVSIETSGLIIVPEVFRKAYAVSLDVKTPSSGVLLTHENIKALNSCAYLYDEVQLKAVVRDEVDLAFLLENFHSILHPTSSKVKPLVLTPCADNTKGSVSAQSILDVVNMCVAWNNKYNIRIIPQIHKWLEVDTEMR